MDIIFLFFAMPGMSEMLLIGAVVLLLFGGKKIPELMKGMGKGISEFKKGMRNEDKNPSEADRKSLDA